jgi:hypothetical protein
MSPAADSAAHGDTTMCVTREHRSTLHRRHSGIFGFVSGRACGTPSRSKCLAVLSKCPCQRRTWWNCSSRLCDSLGTCHLLFAGAVAIFERRPADNSLSAGIRFSALFHDLGSCASRASNGRDTKTPPDASQSQQG